VAKIVSFFDAETEAVFHGRFVKKFGTEIARSARRKMLLIEAAGKLDDLRIPPGNRLEALKRDRAGQHSVRVNDQWRICFVWSEGNVERVELTDYHAG
jgi:proteic killer suppression protein